MAIKSEFAALFDLGDTLTLVLRRFGMQGGKNFVVVGITEELAQGRTELTIFG